MDPVPPNAPKTRPPARTAVGWAVCSAAWTAHRRTSVIERMRAIVEMHHRIGVASRFLSPDETLRHLPILRGGDPVRGAVLNDDAIVHHDAVIWAHLEHLARTTTRIETSAPSSS